MSNRLIGLVAATALFAAFATTALADGSDSRWAHRGHHGHYGHEGHHGPHGHKGHHANYGHYAYSRVWYPFEVPRAGYAPIYVVNQGPHHSGPGLIIPYRIWSQGRYVGPHLYGRPYHPHEGWPHDDGRHPMHAPQPK